MKSGFENLQQLGRALMLPIAVLPAAGILLRIGQPDLCNIPFIAAAGDAIFHNLGFLFALGIAVGLAKENHGAAALAGAIFFLVANTGAKTLMVVPPDVLAGLSGSTLQLAADHFKDGQLSKLGVPLGIISGLTAGWVYNRFHTISLPEYLAFFAGKRFVPIMAGVLGLIPAFVVGTLWTSISSGMDSASHAVLSLGGLGLFIYGLLNRLLIVTGLHHILNNLAWFNLGSYHGVTGDLNRFFAGDPAAGAFMSGFFPVMMFGLPAACLAMYHTAKPERRKEVGGMLASMALTAILTGVTEPIEFSFMFLAPVLFGLHAVLTGLSMLVMNLLGVHLGFGFSAGLFDYVINFGKAQKPLLLIPIGLLYAGLYYSAFRFAIVRFDLKTLGRDTAPLSTVPKSNAPGARGEAYLAALGGAANLKSVDACTTRLRLTVVAQEPVNEAALRALGAKGFVRPVPGALQVVIGPQADQIASEIREAIGHAGSKLAAAKPMDVVAESAVAINAPRIPAEAVLKALGGKTNVKAVFPCASRLVVDVASAGVFDEAALRATGVRAITHQGENVHLIIGPSAGLLAADLKVQLS